MTVNPTPAGISETAGISPKQIAPAGTRVEVSTLVHFVPRWPGNPYHEELAKHLLRCDVRVEDEDCLKSIYNLCQKSHSYPDIIHIHAVPRFGLSGMQALQFLMFWRRVFGLQSHGVQMIWTIHDSTHHESMYPLVDRMFSRMFFHRADAIIVHSAAAAKAVEREFKLRRNDRLLVVPHGNYIGSYPNHISRQEARTKLRVPSGKMVFLFLGMIRPYKGVPGLIEIFKGLANDNLHLIIAGKPLSQELSGEISTAIEGHANIQYRPDHIPAEEVQDYLNAADVVVFPYSKALTSGALILAMSFKRACIAPKLGALEDTLDENGGYLYDPASAGGLREAMELTIREQARLEGMGEHNRRRAEGWPWHKVARLTAEIYQNCVRAGKGRTQRGSSENA